MNQFESLEFRRLFAGAALDPSFGDDGAISQALGSGNFHVTATAVQNGGRLLVGGYRTAVGKSGDIPFLLRFKANGQLDDRFAGNTNVARFSRARVGGLFVEPDGRLLINITSNPAVEGIYGLTVSGKLDSGVRRNTAPGLVQAIDSAGRLVTASESDGQLLIRRFNADGTVDSDFNDGMALRTSFGLPIQLGSAQRTLNVNSITVSDANRIYIGGSYVVAGSSSSYRHGFVARVNGSGLVDEDFYDNGVYEFDADEQADQTNGVVTQVDATSEGVLALYRVPGDGQQQVVYRFAPELLQPLATPAVTSSSQPQIFAQPDDGFVVNDGNFVSRYTASNRYDGSFGHVRIGALSDLRTLSNDGTLYSVATTAATASNGVSSFTLNANRRFIDVGPAPLLNIANLTAAPAGSDVFTVQYRGLSAVQRSSLGNDDLILYRPDGTSARVVFVKADTTANRTVINATYKFAPVGGSWDASDNGLYTIYLKSGSVQNVNNQFSMGRTLGAFRIDLT